MNFRSFVCLFSLVVLFDQLSARHKGGRPFDPLSLARSSDYKYMKQYLTEKRASLRHSGHPEMATTKGLIPKVDIAAPNYEDVEQEYDDFSETRPYWMQGQGEAEFVPSPNKRYLGIEIPDYVSSPSQVSILKKISNRKFIFRMKEVGK